MKTKNKKAKGQAPATHPTKEVKLRALTEEEQDAILRGVSEDADQEEIDHTLESQHPEAKHRRG